jgi:hypothetical protein
MSTASSSPAWAETSVRWLLSHHTHYVGVSAGKPFTERLHKALLRMSWMEWELVHELGMSKKEHSRHIMESIGSWDEVSHKEMVKFIETGGYEAKSKGAVTVEVHAKDGSISHEKLEIELDAIVEGLRPASQLSPDHELDEILASESLKTDPRYGAW